MLSLTVENYLKALYLLAEEKGTPVPLGDLAKTLALTPGTVTTMIQRLERTTDLIEYQPRQGASLTRCGVKAALKILRRHRIVESFLVEIVGLDWTEVHEEAEHLEHAISDRLIEKLAALLSNPDYDPHGAPIPTSSGKMPRDRRFSLARAHPGIFPVACLQDDSASFLAFACDGHLTPGAEIELTGRDELADTFSIKIRSGSLRGRTLQLVSQAASKIMVREVDCANAGDRAS
jgi:DtxR family Mn-dependent transcriptional regulator